jgi:hypothetical protein
MTLKRKGLKSMTIQLNEKEIATLGFCLQVAVLRAQARNYDKKFEKEVIELFEKFEEQVATEIEQNKIPEVL